MAKYLKFFLYGLIAVLVLVVGSAVVLTQINPNRFKGVIISQVKEKTGRDLTLNGDIHLKYYPWIHVELNDIILSNASEFEKTPFFKADTLQLRVKTLPLIQNQIQMDIFKVHGAAIHLGKDSQGRPSWADLTGAAQPASPQKDSGKQPAAPPAAGSLLIGGLDIRDASLTWEDRSSGQTLFLKDIDISTGQLVLGEPVELKLSLNAESNQPALTAGAVLNGTIRYQLEEEKYTVQSLIFESLIKSRALPDGQARIRTECNIGLDLKADTASISDLVIELPGARASGELSIKALRSETPSIAGRILIDGTDVSLPFKLAEIQPLAGQLAQLEDRTFNLKTSFDSDLANGRAQIKELELKLLGADINGSAVVDRLNTKLPLLKGRFSASGPNLPFLMQVAGTMSGKKKTPLKTYGQKLSSVSRKAFDLDADFDIDLEKGSIHIPTFAVNTLGLNLTGKVSGSHIQTPDSTLSGSLAFEGKNLSPLFKAIGNDPLADTLSGLSVDAQITGKSGTYSFSPLIINASVLTTDNAPQSVNLNTQTSINLKQQVLEISSLSLKGLGMDVTGSGSLTQFLSDPQVKAGIDVAPFNLNQLFRRLDIQTVAAADKTALSKVGLKMNIAGSKDQLKLSDLTARLDETTLQGNLSVKEMEKPDIAFNFDIDTLNADRYLPAPDKSSSGKSARKTDSKKDQPGKDQPDLSRLRSLTAKGKITIGKLIISNLKLARVRVDLDAMDGIIRLNPVSADLYDGQYAGDILMNVQSQTPELILKGDLTNVQAEPLLTDLTGNAKLKGKGSVTLDLNSTGITPQQLMAGLNGKMNFNFQDGAIKGFNMGKFLRRLKSFRSNQTFAVSEQEETDFAVLTGNPVIKNGVVQLDDLDGKSPAFRIQGKGMVADLVNNAIDYTANVTVVETSKGQAGKELSELDGVTIPVRIKGALKDPDIQPDISAILANLATKRLTEKLGVKIPGTTKDSTSEDSSQKVDSKESESPSDPKDVLKKTLEKEAGSLLRKLF